MFNLTLIVANILFILGIPLYKRASEQHGMKLASSLDAINVYKNPRKLASLVKKALIKKQPTQHSTTISPIYIVQHINYRNTGVTPYKI